MKSYRKELWLEVPTQRAFINITPNVEKCPRESECYLYCLGDCDFKA